MKNDVLRIENLTKVFDTPEGPVHAVREVSLEVEEDEFFSLLGPSGCGKTTTLRMIAGLETVTSGSIAFKGRDLSRLPSAERNLGMVFQSYALFPHMTVFDNAAYGLRLRHVPAKQVRDRVMELLSALGLEGLHGRYPSDLSGGQQQRVSIARALAYDPDMFLLDEPLSNLDAKLRVQMREEIRRIQKDLGVLAVYVTHDQEEAMSVSDRIGVFRAGRLMQVGVPQDIYRDPTSLFVADFIGKINFFPCTVVAADSAGGKVALRSGREVVVGRFHPLDESEREEFGVETRAVLAVRPEHIELRPHDAADGPVGVVRRELFLGSIVRYFIDCDDATRTVVVESAHPPADVAEGDTVRLVTRPEHALCFRG